MTLLTKEFEINLGKLKLVKMADIIITRKLDGNKDVVVTFFK